MESGGKRIVSYRIITKIRNHWTWRGMVYIYQKKLLIFDLSLINGICNSGIINQAMLIKFVVTSLLW